eukprot:gene28335-31456_t
MHFGESRTWYTVPAHARAKMEIALMDDKLAAAAMQTSAALPAPLTLQRAGIPVSSVVQDSGRLVPTCPGAYTCGFCHRMSCFESIASSGQMVVTFPGAYTSSFCHGMSCCESIACAPWQWWREAETAAQLYRLLRKPQLFSQERLAMDLGKQLTEMTPGSHAELLVHELERLSNELFSQERLAMDLGKQLTEMTPSSHAELLVHELERLTTELATAHCILPRWSAVAALAVWCACITSMSSVSAAAAKPTSSAWCTGFSRGLTLIRLGKYLKPVGNPGFSLASYL